MLLPGSRDEGITAGLSWPRSKRRARGHRRRREEGTSSGRARWFRVPPPSRDHDRLRGDLAVAREVLADDIDIVEAPIADGQNGRVADAPRLEAPELGPLQRECGVDG